MNDTLDTRAVLPFDPTALLAEMGIGTNASAVLAKYQAGDLDSLARAAVKRTEAEKAAAAGGKPVMHLWAECPRTHQVPFLNGEMATEQWNRLAVSALAGHRAAQRKLEAMRAAVEWRDMPFFARRKIYGRHHHVCHPETWAGMSAKEQGMFEMREAKG